MLSSKLIIFVENASGFICQYLIRFLESLSKTQKLDIGIYCQEGQRDLFEKLGCLYINTQKDLGYFVKNNDPRIYEGLLKFASENGIKRIYIPRLNFPEYLLSELNIGDYPFDIILGIFSFELMSKSRARSNVVVQLFSNHNIFKIIQHTIGFKNNKGPAYFQIDEKCKEKLKVLSEPDYEDPSEYYTDDLNALREKYSFGKSNFVFLYFGNMFYGKGVDILLDSFQYAQKQMHLIVAGDPKTKNFDFNFRDKSNITLFDEFIPHKKMIELFVISDCIVLPYRNSYEFGTSGVFHQAMLARRPLVVPDIEPFGSASIEFNCGEVFNCEDAASLSTAMSKVFSRNPQDYLPGIENYLKQRSSWSDVVDLVFN